tara:strand:- start:725 stop:982 length:258 start_codon:yes stop_codon:yes gene_type:complete
MKNSMYFLKYPTKVRDVNMPNSSDWTECNIIVNNRKDFIVSQLVINDKIYLKPIKPYNMYEFEILFSFGIMCENFDINKCVLVIK